jgi:hypothetical protein
MIAVAPELSHLRAFFGVLPLIALIVRRSVLIAATQTISYRLVPGTPLLQQGDDRHGPRKYSQE